MKINLSGKNLPSSSGSPKSVDDDFIMRWGKYKGEKLGDIPEDYLNYLWGQDWFTEQKYGGLFHYVRLVVTKVQGREE